MELTLQNIIIGLTFLLSAINTYFIFYHRKKDFHLHLFKEQSEAFKTILDLLANYQKEIKAEYEKVFKEINSNDKLSIHEKKEHLKNNQFLIIEKHREEFFDTINKILHKSVFIPKQVNDAVFNYFAFISSLEFDTDDNRVFTEGIYKTNMDEFTKVVNVMRESLKVEKLSLSMRRKL